MFSKSSRYRHLPESSTLDANGERQLGKDLRLIPTTAGGYLHTVRDGDRLDLVAYKYYGDPAKWWQISDANPEQAFPTDLMDSWPVVGEQLLLEHAGFKHRFGELLAELRALISGTNGPATLITLESLNSFNSSEVNELVETSAVIYEPPGNFTSSIVLIYPQLSVARSDLLGKLQENGFNLLDSDEWSVQGKQALSFIFDDPAVKLDWQKMMDELADLTGVLQAHSIAMGEALNIFYVSAHVTHSALLEIIKGKGFNLASMSTTLSRTGATFIVPPNQIL